jgi:hypothetical protein
MNKIESAYKEMMEDVQMSGEMIAYCMKDKALEIERELTAVTEQRDRLAEALRNCLPFITGDGCGEYSDAREDMKTPTHTTPTVDLDRLVRLVDTFELTAEQEEAHSLSMRDFSFMQEGKALSRAIAYRTAASMIRNEFWKAWQAARERQWMPIESAPKDTPILASDQFGVTSVVYWRDVSSSHLPRYAWSSHYDNEYMHHVEAFPTHWMPLPNPPTNPNEP